MNGKCPYKIKDKEVQLHFAMPAMGKIVARENKYPAVSGDYYSPSGIAYIIYAGYWCDVFVNEGEQEFTFADFNENIEDEVLSGALSDQTRLAMKTFEESKLIAKKKETPVESPSAEKPKEKKS